ncbi:nitrilase-like protein 1 [Actinidia rufa]|uniref:Nitrilase-like protein 1 n=1 Tax=Actinidia rufa TaxID=165716 RepID=A0A7J0HAW2_9ERIC|nr:nitrilase-like protein 1 [Actinidia rufa]
MNDCQTKTLDLETNPLLWWSQVGLTLGFPPVTGSHFLPLRVVVTALILLQVPIVTGHVHSINDSVSNEQAADDYEFIIRQLVRTHVISMSEISDCLKFDLVLLGMGPNGHVASLFPNHSVLGENYKWVTFITESPKPPPERITFTLPVINSASNVAVVATGISKVEALHLAIDDVGTVCHCRRGWFSQPMIMIPVSFFEESNNAHYNSIAIIDADGTYLGLYRKSHIPDGPGYQEKFYFKPGDTGFKWFPESARAMALQGAEILYYPTAIGSEIQDAGIDSCDHWRGVIQGHAGANEIIETEHGNSGITFYGNSFITGIPITGPTGEIVASADDKEEAILVAQFDLDKIKSKRHSWGVFRDPRLDLYKVLLTLDGSNPQL